LSTRNWSITWIELFAGAIKQYEGLKQIDDRRSSLLLANLLRLKILPTGYICLEEECLTRDLLPKRLLLVRHRTSLVLNVKNILARNFGGRMKTYDIKKLKASKVSTSLPMWRCACDHVKHREYGITWSMSRSGNCYDNAYVKSFIWCAQDGIDPWGAVPFKVGSETEYL
jgi:hypothetical protein